MDPGDDYVYTFTYDDAGRVLTENEPFGLSLTFGYDAAGNRTSVTDSTGGSVTSVYDAENRLTSRTGVAPESIGGTTQLGFGLSYDTAGRLSTLTRSENGGQTDYGYDADGHLTSITTAHTTQTMTDDAAGRVQTEQMLVNGGSYSSMNYWYDSASQVVNTSAGPVAPPKPQYSYDAAGNRTMTGYVTGADNELQSDGTWNYYYDGEGNMIGKQSIATGVTITYQYDQLNLLVGINGSTV